ncbi:MAG: outer membrane lipoprotein chaperone LolA [Oleibacter sp.]|nr:outer membrane lipoprotein chaperone LolA [Thalassolituus sp.]
MLKKCLLSVCVFIPALFFTATASAAPATTTALEDFIARLDALASFDAAFTQQTVDGNNSVLQSISGQLSVSRPGRLRWKTSPPYEQVVISDGRSVWVYDQDLEQVTIRDLEQRLQDTPALLLSGDTSQIEANYLVSETVDSTVKDSKVIFKLLPKDQSQLFESLEFIYQGSMLTQMRIYDVTGQLTQINFSKQRINPNLKDSLFTFTPPKGIDVIDGRTRQLKMKDSNG